jgi:hypothetical protein
MTRLMAIRPSSQSIEGIVAYQISALFRDGSLLLTDVQWGPTPEMDETISVLRNGVSVWGTVVALKRKKLIFSRAPDQIVDEVQFYESSKVAEPPASKTRRLLYA